MKTQAQWLKDFHKKHGNKFDYSFMPRDIRGRTKFDIVCPQHGTFQQSPTAHLVGRWGCLLCSQDEFRKTSEQRAATKRAYEARDGERERRNTTARELYANSETERARITERNLNRYHRDKHKPANKAQLLCRSLLARTILAAKGVKTARTYELLGYSHEQLRARIESQFETWMTWQNHGEWHVDHVKPLAVFVSEGVTDPKVINALSNLRPLSAAANIAKGARLT